MALTAILEPLGENMVTAASGREALRQLLHQEFALILMDVRMADMDGLETARLIRSRPQTEHVPIIFVTAFERAEVDVSAGYEVGAADFVFKPFQPDALRAKVSVFVDLFHKTERVRRQAERLRVMEEREHRRKLALAERGRQTAEARFENILALAPDGVLAFDDSGTVLLFNQGAEQLFGYRAEEVIGGPVDALLAVPENGSEPHRAEVIARRKGGDAFPAELSVSRLQEAERTITTVICRDITDRRLNEERERQINRELHERLRTGVEMVASLAATLNPAEVMNRLLRRVVESVEADQGTLLLVVEGGRLIVQEAYDLDHRDALRPGTEFTRLPILERAVAEGRPHLNGGIAASFQPVRLREWLDGVKETAALPIRVGDQTAAVILLARRRRAAFGEREMDTLELIGNVAAAALRNAQLFSQAEAASISKSEFLNMAAHELRTPLSVITGYLSMLSDGTLGHPNEGWMRPIDILNAKAAELNKLVDALLLAARMEGGTIHGEAEVADLAELALEAVHRAEGRAHLLEAEVIFEAPPEPVLVEVDPGHVARIIDNLVNNALTYSPGKPWVKVTVTGRAEVVVEDRGLGVPPDRAEAIFERFYRVNDPSLPPQPGTGLGLYLSRELAQRYGGTVVLEASAPGRGSKFVLRLTAAMIDQPAASLLPSGEPGA